MPTEQIERYLPFLRKRVAVEYLQGELQFFLQEYEYTPDKYIAEFRNVDNKLERQFLPRKCVLGRSFEARIRTGSHDNSSFSWERGIVVGLDFETRAYIFEYTPQTADGHVELAAVLCDAPIASGDTPVLRRLWSYPTAFRRF